MATALIANLRLGADHALSIATTMLLLIALFETVAVQSQFLMVPSKNTKISRCDLSKPESVTCYQECVRDVCCRAIALPHSSNTENPAACYKSPWPLEEFDLVKKDPNYRIPDSCVCALSVRHGLQEGTEFSFADEFQQFQKPIRKFVAYINNGIVTGIELQFGEDTLNVARQIDNVTGTTTTVCDVRLGRKIRTVRTYVNAGGQIIGFIIWHLDESGYNAKCSLGTKSGTYVAGQGNFMLYISGGYDPTTGRLQGITYHFDTGCRDM